MVALSGDYDFQFMIEELAVGAQFKLPVHPRPGEQRLPGPDPAVAARLRHGLPRAAVVRQHQLRGLRRRHETIGGYGVDHVKVAEALGCKAIRVIEPEELLPALEKAKTMMVEYRVPVIVEVILERVTNISMGVEIDNVVEFEELARTAAGRPHRHLDARLSRSE